MKTEYATKFAIEAVNDRGSTKSDRSDFLTRFLQKHKEDPADMSMEAVMTICFGNIGAGSDTTAISLRAMIYFLFKHPRKLACLRKEIDDMSDKGLISDPITFAESNRMPYLQAVMKEAMRLHPATGLILGREVPRNGTTICGRYFPRGVSLSSI